MSDASARKERAARWSIVASAGMTVAKLAAGLASGSLALLSEAAHGLLDVGATILTYFAIRAADRPADETHHYGHAKIEAVAALAQTGFLLALALWVLVEALQRLMGLPTPVDVGWLAFGVLAFSIAIDLWRWRGLARIAAETGSAALEADALHFSSDLVSSALVIAGLAATRLGFAQGDTFAALGVALFIAIAGYRLGRRTIDTLVDAAPAGLTAQVEALARAVPGVVTLDEVKLRRAGAQVLGELKIGVSRTLPLDRVAAIKGAVEAAILTKVPQAAVTVTANPRALDNETIIERVLLAAALRRLPVHNVTVQDVDGVTCIGLDLEIDAAASHGGAHELATGLEAAIRAELGGTVEVETHVEPLETRELVGRDAGPDATAEIAQALAKRAIQGGVVTDIHNVRARETDAGLVVNYHCRVNPALSVARVHAEVDALDRRLRLDFPRVARIVGHAEPVRKQG